MFYFLLFLSGLAGGLLGGMGMGGGTILIPMLTIFLKVCQKEAQAYNLLAFLPMAVVAIIMHIKSGLINIKMAITLAIPALLLSVAGSFLVSFIKGNLQSKLFGGFLVALSVCQFVFSFKEEKSKNDNKISAKSDKKMQQ